MPSATETAIRKVVGKGIMKVAAFNRNRLDAPDKPHPFLTGIHAPMTAEFTLDTLRVEGEIPRELDGRYLRIGPNPAKAPNPAAYHWFIGDGMAHGLRLKDGKVLWYRNRWVRSKPVSAALGEAEKPGPRHPPGDTVNTNIIGYAGKTWAVVEAGAYPVELTEDLETVAHNPFEGTLQHGFSAHPHRDPDTGELHAICYFSENLNTIHHVVVDTNGKVRREEPITVKHGPSVHDCMITKRFVLVFDLPVTFSMKTLLAGQPFPYAWNPAHDARVGLLPREGKGSEIIWCDVDPCYLFHPCNAYETDDGKVIVDVAVHDTMFAESVQGPDSNTTTFERWTMDASGGKVARRVLDTTPQEFPRCDERLTGKPYRYAYAMPLAPVGDEFLSQTHYIKHDLHAGTRELHQFGANRYPGEFVFVPRHATGTEDEGWLMGFVINTANQTTDLVILDAQNFSAKPVATITVPHRIPPGFHGNWVPS